MMSKKQKKAEKQSSKNTIIIIGGIIGIAGLIAYFSMNLLIPVNGTVPVFVAPQNSYIVTKHSSDAGYYYASKSTSSGKKSTGITSASPTIHLQKGELESIHMINEDDDTRSSHNINVDAFNVHSKDLGYFESQTITFIADKQGSFKYYCTLHPEMSGTIIVS